jgi:O-antigen/teichoic acid export membrane protein
MDQVLKALPGPLGRGLSEIFSGKGDNARSQRGALLAFGIRVASAGILFFSQVLLARWLGLFEYGIYTYVWVWLTVLGTMCGLGFASTVVRFLPEYAEKQEQAYARGFLRAGHSLTFLAGVFCAVAGLAALYFLQGWYNEAYQVPMALALLALPAFAMTDYQDGVGRSQSWLTLALAPPYIFRPMMLIVLVGIAFLAGWPMSAVTAAYALVAAMWVTAIVQYVLQKRAFTQVLPAGPRQYRLKFWVLVSLPVLLMEGFTLVMMNMDVLLLDLFVEPDQIGIYYATARTISLIAFVHFAVAAAVMPRFATSYANGDNAAIQQLLRQSRMWTLLPSLAGAVALIALGKPLLWLFGTEFTAGYPLMFILVLGLLARAGVGPTQGLLVVTGRQNLAAFVLSGAVIANIVLNLTLIPKFGLAGAAWATSIAYGFEAVTLYIIAKKTFVAGDENPERKEPDVSSTQ